jgi:hypothetical protein
MKQVKDIIIHNQIKNLSSLYVMLFSSISSTVVQRRDGPADVVECTVSPAVKSAVEVALIDICNQVSDIVKDPERWSLDMEDIQDYNAQLEAAAKRAEEEILAALMAEAGKAKRQTTKKKGGKDGE